MPNPHPIELRERAVRSYEHGEGTYPTVSELFGVSRSALQSWVKLYRETGSLEPQPKGGGTPSPVNLRVFSQVVAAKPDATTEEMTRVYNQKVTACERVHRSSVQRALIRSGFVYKKKTTARRS